MFLLRHLTVTCFVAVLLSGCIKPKPQMYWEEKAASHTIRRLHLYDALNPAVAKTNVGQVFTNIDDRPYPGDFHREFQRYGKYAGFTNSFYEKYVFITGLVTNLAKGRPVLLSSSPFPDRDKRMHRIVIYETIWQGEPTYAYAPVPEDFVQKAFQQTGLGIPEPPRFPPSPPIPPPPAVPFSQRKHAYFRDLAVQIGMNSYHGRILENVTEALGVISIVALCFLALRSMRRSKKNI